MGKKKVSEAIVERGGEHRRNLVNLMREVGYKHNLWNVFEDFLRLSAISIANTSDIYHMVNSKDAWDEREKRYMDTIKKYGKEERMMFPQMLAELVEELERQVQSERYTDVLGEVFHELELHNKWKGQFFTPQHICDMMGKIVLDPDNLRRKVKAYGYVSVNEPCCGAGAMLYGFLNAFRDEGFNPCSDALLVAQDLDERCVHMAYIQCSLYGIPAIVQQMNTLSMQAYGEPWYTPVYIIGMWHWKERHAHDLQLANEELTAALAM